MTSSPGKPRIGNSNTGVGMTLVLGCAEKSARRRRQKAVPRMRKGTEYPAAIAAPLMPGLEDHERAECLPTGVVIISSSQGRKGEAMVN